MDWNFGIKLSSLHFHINSTRLQVLGQLIFRYSINSFPYLPQLHQHALSRGKRKSWNPSSLFPNHKHAIDQLFSSNQLSIFDLRSHLPSRRSKERSPRRFNSSDDDSCFCLASCRTCENIWLSVRADRILILDHHRVCLSRRQDVIAMLSPRDNEIGSARDQIIQPGSGGPAI